MLVVRGVPLLGSVVGRASVRSKGCVSLALQVCVCVKLRGDVPV